MLGSDSAIVDINGIIVWGWYHESSLKYHMLYVFMTVLGMGEPEKFENKSIKCADKKEKVLDIHEKSSRYPYIHIICTLYPNYWSIRHALWTGTSPFLSSFLLSRTKVIKEKVVDFFMSYKFFFDHFFPTQQKTW